MALPHQHRALRQRKGHRRPHHSNRTLAFKISRSDVEHSRFIAAGKLILLQSDPSFTCNQEVVSSKDRLGGSFIGKTLSGYGRTRNRCGIDAHKLVMPAVRNNCDQCDQGFFVEMLGRQRNDVAQRIPLLLYVLLTLGTLLSLSPRSLTDLEHRTEYCYSLPYLRHLELR